MKDFLKKSVAVFSAAALVIIGYVLLGLLLNAPVVVLKALLFFVLCFFTYKLITKPIFYDEDNK